MNNHFVQRRNEQGAIVKPTPCSNMVTSTVDTESRSATICAPHHPEPQHLQLKVRLAQSDSPISACEQRPDGAVNLFLPHVFHGSTLCESSDGDIPGSDNAGIGSEMMTPQGQDVSPHSNPATSALPAGQRRILIVDDNIDAAESLGELLKVCGHDIHIAHDGASAISEAVRLRPEAVILDIGLPAMNGYEVAQRLRLDVGLDTSLLVALTGYAEDSDRISAQEAGFDHYFAKPLDINKLVTVLDNMK